MLFDLKSEELEKRMYEFDSAPVGRCYPFGGPFRKQGAITAQECRARSYLPNRARGVIGTRFI
jgi:hypothetical protein